MLLATLRAWDNREYENMNAVDFGLMMDLEFDLFEEVEKIVEQLDRDLSNISWTGKGW